MTSSGQAICSARSQADRKADRIAKNQAAVSDSRMSGSAARRNTASGSRDECAAFVRLRKRLLGRTYESILPRANVKGEMGIFIPSKGDNNARAETHSGNCCTKRAEIRPPMLCPTITVLCPDRPPQ